MTQAQHILNTGEGLDRLMGDTGLYRQLLLRFCKDYQHAVSQLRDMLASDALAAAQRKAHTLKGAAGMIGARELHHLAGVTEAGLASSNQALHAGLEPLHTALHALLEAIEGYLHAQQGEHDDGVAVSQENTVVHADALPLLTRLAHLLDEGNGTAIDVLEQSATMLAASLGVAVFQEVAAAAHEFDFEAALMALMAQVPTLSTGQAAHTA